MSLFSGSSGRKAAMANAVTAQNYQQQIDALLNNAQGMGASALTGAQGQQISALGQGYNTARNDFTQARAQYDPFTEQGLSAWGMLGNATGLNGAEGNAAATGTFQASPGYQYNVNQAMDQTARGAAATGQLLGGNTLTALQDRANNLANQEFGNWFNRTQGLSDVGFNAAGAQAGIDQGQGKLAYGYGSDQSGVYGDTASRLAGLYTGIAGQRANALSNLGSQLIGANNQSAKAQQDAETNKLNLLLGLASSAASLGGGLYGMKR